MGSWWRGMGGTNSIAGINGAARYDVYTIARLSNTAAAISVMIPDLLVDLRVRSDAE